MDAVMGTSWVAMKVTKSVHVKVLWRRELSAPEWARVWARALVEE